MYELTISTYGANIDRVYHVPMCWTIMLYFMLLVTLWVNQQIIFHQQWNMTCLIEMCKNSLIKSNMLTGKLSLKFREPQNACTKFHNVTSKTYDKCFPYKRYKSGYATKKPWITTAIRESIKTKNKLYIDRNKGSNPELQWQNYKMYCNKLNRLIHKAERKYYQDMLLENKSN